MRIIFCGTPQFAVPCLKHFLTLKDFEITAVITQPDRPQGRTQEVVFSPVKQVALAAGIAVHQPERIRIPEAEKLLREIAPDAIAIIAFGQIIPARFLDIPRLGWINLHASLLPKYRGAAPIQWAIANGETKTGVTTMRIDAGMDTGEIALQQELSIGATETTPELSERLSAAGAPLMERTLRGLVDGTLKTQAQDHGAATMAPVLKKGDGAVRWTMSAVEVFDRQRAFTPWPGIHTTFRKQIVQLIGAPGSEQRTDLAPGKLVWDGRNLSVACGGGSLFRLEYVKVEGRKQVTAQEFGNGARIAPGERFGEV
ncbi:MAG: methionyl-tRNA formyltransferase [Acidobacteria bacterium]|nr:methionyl-tRNA formyltransferase [Acidobacteriota bacterium]MBS1867350.1 methionyl-tRNA formyltransferase [Acidobacteriota bacterium]